MRLKKCTWFDKQRKSWGTIHRAVIATRVRVPVVEGHSCLQQKFRQAGCVHGDMHVVIR